MKFLLFYLRWRQARVQDFLNRENRQVRKVKKIFLAFLARFAVRLLYSGLSGLGKP